MVDTVTTITKKVKGMQMNQMKTLSFKTSYPNIWMTWCRCRCPQRPPDPICWRRTWPSFQLGRRNQARLGLQGLGGSYHNRNIAIYVNVIIQNRKGLCRPLGKGRACWLLPRLHCQVMMMIIIIINVVIRIYIRIITTKKTGSRSTSGGTTAETVASSTAPPARDTR